jgi:hypothetical protein
MSTQKPAVETGWGPTLITIISFRGYSLKDDVTVILLIDVSTEYTELQPLLSGVHSVMRVKLVLAGEGGGCTPTPSLYIYHHQRRYDMTGDFKCREVKTGFCRNRSMQTGSSGTLIGWKSGQTTYVPLWERMEGVWLWTH